MSHCYMNVEKRTLWLPMCPTVASMARGGRGDITNNKPSQCFTSPSPYTHVQGAYGAPTGASEAPTSKILRHLHSRLCADVRQKNTIAAFYRHYRMPLLCFFGTYMRTNGCGDAANRHIELFSEMTRVWLSLKCNRPIAASRAPWEKKSRFGPN